MSSKTTNNLSFSGSNSFVFLIVFILIIYKFENLDFIGIRPDSASTVLVAAKNDFAKQWRPANDAKDEEEVVYSWILVPQLGKQFRSSKIKSFTAFLPGDLMGRVTPAAAPYVENNDPDGYLKLPQ
jgi:hypothetical protein